MNNVIPLQNSPERVSLLPIAPGVDFATALSLRRMATSTGATPAYLLAPEVSALSFLYAGSASPYAVRHPLEYRNAYWRSPDADAGII